MVVKIRPPVILGKNLLSELGDTHAPKRRDPNAPRQQIALQNRKQPLIGNWSCRLGGLLRCGPERGGGGGGCRPEGGGRGVLQCVGVRGGGGEGYRLGGAEGGCCSPAV